MMITAIRKEGDPIVRVMLGSKMLLVVERIRFYGLSRSNDLWAIFVFVPDRQYLSKS